MECPSEAALLDLVAGALEASARVETEAHVSSCERCRVAVTALASSTLRPAPLQPAAPLPRGAELGRYVVLDLVGEGAMGRVYAAYDPVLDRKVALKLIHPMKEGADARARLLREAKAMARVSHPNLVAVHDAGEHQGAVFIAMEFVEGVTLRGWLAQRPRSPEEILRAFCEAGRGLAAAHEASLVHRDFKPENVLVGKDGRVRVSDFGLAAEPGMTTAADAVSPQVDASLTMTGQLVGTPAYMAPEQLAGQRADARADQFAFCVALHEALCGQRPFERNTQAVVRATPLKVTAPTKVARVLARGLSADAPSRFDTMPALLHALEAAQRRPLSRWAALGAAAVLAAVGGAFVVGSRAPARLCGTGAERAQGVWSEHRRADLEAHFTALSPDAPEALLVVKRALDQYTNAWADMHRDACEATRVRGEQSDHLLALRMACLDRRLVELDAALGVLATTDAKGIPGAVESAHALTPLTVCANVQVLEQRLPAPENPRLAQDVNEVQRTLAVARALKEAGRVKEALPMVTEAALKAHALTFVPVEAEALALRGELQQDDGDFVGSEPTLRDAYAYSVAARDDRLATRTAVSLAFSLGELTRLREADEWVWHAGATLKRLGADQELEARVANQEGHLCIARGDWPGASTKYQRAYELRRALLGEHHPSTAAMLANLANAQNGQDKFEEALVTFRRALELATTELGAGHPRIAAMHNGAVSALLNLDRNDEALHEVDAALPPLVKMLGEHHTQVARLQANRATALYHLGRYDEAVAQGRVALETFEAAKMKLMVAESNIFLGEATGALKRYDEARGHFARAREIVAASAGADNDEVSAAYESEGEVLLNEHPKDALQCFREALKLRISAHGEEATENAMALLGIGRALISAGERSQAVEPLTRARQLLKGSELSAQYLQQTEDALALALGEHATASLH